MSNHSGRSHDWNGKRKSTKANRVRDYEVDTIREQQHHHHQMAQNNTEERYRHPPKVQIVVLLENGISFCGTAVMFNNPNMPQCKVFFKDEGNRELSIAVEVNLQAPGHEKVAVLQSIINSQLMALHEEAMMDFPEWLEKHSTKANEKNPYFNLDEIRAEFKYKQSRFGFWRIAARAGFFDDVRPQFAKCNKIAHLEIREPEPDRPN